MMVFDISPINFNAIGSSMFTDIKIYYDGSFRTSKLHLPFLKASHHTARSKIEGSVLRMNAC